MFCIMRTDDEIIELFGGNQVVADICAPTLPAVVSGWRKRGIPRAWRALLKQTRPDLFDGEEVKPAQEAA
jgi:hypothetical protein